MLSEHFELYFWPCQPQTQNDSNIAKTYLIKSFTDPVRLGIKFHNRAVL